MPKIISGQGYRHPTNVTPEQASRFGSPASENGSGGYSHVYTPEGGQAGRQQGPSGGSTHVAQQVHARETSGGPGRQQGSAGGSAYMDAQVHARDSAGSAGRQQGSAGGSAYMDAQVHARDSAGGGGSLSSAQLPNGVSTFFAPMYAREEYERAQGDQARAASQAAYHSGQVNGQREKLDGSRQGIAKRSQAAWLAQHPDMKVAGKLTAFQWTEKQHQLGSFQDNLVMGGPSIVDYGIKVQSPKLLGGSGMLFPMERISGHEKNSMYSCVVVEEPFWDAVRDYRAKGIFDVEKNKRVLKDSWRGAPTGPSFNLTDGRVAQPFKGFGYLVKTGDRIERWPKEKLEKEGLLPAKIESRFPAMPTQAPPAGSPMQMMMAEKANTNGT